MRIDSRRLMGDGGNLLLVQAMKDLVASSLTRLAGEFVGESASTTTDLIGDLCAGTIGFGDFGGDNSGAATFGLGLLVLGDTFFVGLSFKSFGLVAFGELLMVSAAIFGFVAAGETWVGPVVMAGLLVKVSGSLLAFGLSGGSTRGAIWILVLATDGTEVEEVVLAASLGDDVAEAAL